MKVRLHYTCAIAGADSHEDVEVPDDTDDEELERMAEDNMWNDLQPEWWFKKLEDNNECD